MRIFQKKITKELLWFTISVIGSFLFWCALALIVDQKIVLDECLYDREGKAFMMTIVFIYFIRLSARVN
jgi:ABC-type sugar transport system permease subunit